ncbi:MAG: hypothetical protein JWP97_5926 [Labilithrix sp.]|nr:hypothetical protein [Labilithrix sp.]
MRVRLVGQATLARWAAFALWLGAACALPLHALHPSLSVVTALLLGGGFLWLSPLSPIPLVTRIFARRLARRLQQGGRVDLVGYRGHVEAVVALLAGGTLWTLPLFAGAYAVKHPGIVGVVIAILVLAVTTAGIGALAYGTDEDVVTLGVDGLRIAEHGFVPYGSVTSLEVERGRLSVRRVDGPELVLQLGTLADAVSADIERRRVASPEASVREVEVHSRVAAVPTDELLATLRDGRAPREERVRVAEILRATAPAEIERVAEETADEELRARIRV